MGISLFGMGTGIMPAKTLGQVWRPKSQKLSVGRELCPLSATAFDEQKRTVTLADGDDVRFASHEIFGFAKAAARSGLRVKNFRSVDTENLTYSNAARLPAAADDPDAMARQEIQARRQNLAELTKSAEVYKNGDRLVTFSDNTLSVWEIDKERNSPKLLAKQTITGDTRLSWDKENNPVFHTGGQALTGGTLKAVGENEILVRMSGANVEAGNGTTVLNLSGKKGSFSGGDGVTYLGAYSDCEISGGTGKTDYAGYFANTAILASAGQGVFSGVFENMDIEAGESADRFTGYFSATTINGGDGNNEFKGMFLNGTTAQGGKDDDTFNGRFVDSLLNGGAGKNNFGTYIDINTMKRIVARDGYEYQGLESDFINAGIEAGDGDDTLKGAVWGGSVNLGDGDNTVSGIFSESRVNAGAGNDTIAAMYSRNTVFEAGDGSDRVSLATAFSSTVRTGEGSTSVTLGHNVGESSRATGAEHGGDAVLSGTLWRTARQERNSTTADSYGELAGNSVDASVGENAVIVKTGSGVQSVRTGEAKPEKDPSGRPEKEAEQSVSPATKSPAGMDSLPDAADFLAEAGTARETGEKKRRRQTALQRYARQSGDGPVAGSPGAVIKTGAGEDISIRTYDSINTIEPPRDYIRRTTRRSTGFGYYTWDDSMA